MGFCFFAAKNVFRSKLRSFFVILMLTLGVLCIITSLSLSGIVLSSLEELSGGDSNLMIYGDDLTLTDLNKIQNTDDVEDAAAVFTYILGYNNDSLIVKSFISPKSDMKNSIIPGLGSIHLLEGSMISDTGNQLVLTQKTAEKLDKNVGDTVYITGIVPISLKQNSKNMQPHEVDRNFKITGIIENIKYADGIIPSKTASQLAFNKKENIETIAIITKPIETENVKNTLINTYPMTIEPSELPRLLAKVFSYITCFIVLVGVFLMTFTTFKSIGERTREIGVLKSLGWNNKRVMGLIFIESVVKLTIAWIISILIISILVLYIAHSNNIDLNQFINSNIKKLIHILGISILYSSIIPVIGTILPLWRVARLKPTEALRYE